MKLPRLSFHRFEFACARRPHLFGWNGGTACGVCVGRFQLRLTRQ